MLDFIILVVVFRYIDMFDIFSYIRDGVVVRVVLYAFLEFIFDYNMVVIFVLVVGIVVMGGYWVGMIEVDR